AEWSLPAVWSATAIDVEVHELHSFTSAEPYWVVEVIAARKWKYLAEQTVAMLAKFATSSDAQRVLAGAAPAERAGKTPEALKAPVETAGDDSESWRADLQQTCDTAVPPKSLGKSSDVVDVQDPTLQAMMACIMVANSYDPAWKGSLPFELEKDAAQAK